MRARRRWDKPFGWVGQKSAMNNKTIKYSHLAVKHRHRVALILLNTPFSEEIPLLCTTAIGCNARHTAFANVYGPCQALEAARRWV